jgi:hypothetical protein
MKQDPFAFGDQGPACVDPALFLSLNKSPDERIRSCKWCMSLQLFSNHRFSAFLWRSSGAGLLIELIVGRKLYAGRLAK